MSKSAQPLSDAPLASILNDIVRAIDAKLYYPALLVALTVPEICSGLSLDKAEFVKESHYSAFVDKYTVLQELGIDGIDCYRLRGGVVHRADMAGHPKFDWTHVVFTIPETGSSVHALSLVFGDKNAAALDLKTFCSAMIKAARSWYGDHKDDPQVVKNMKDLIRFCPDGLSPFYRGAPIVASGA